MAVASNVLRRRGCLRPGAALVPVGGRVFHTSDKHSLFILYLEDATARVVPVGRRVFHTEDKRVLFRERKIKSVQALVMVL